MTATMMDKKELIARAETLVRCHMAKYDPSHDWAHVERVRSTAIRIANTFEQKPDMLVVELTALFHDMADGVLPIFSVNPGTHKAEYTEADDALAKYGETSALPTLLCPFFESANLPDEQVNLIQRIIPAISYSTESRLIKDGGWTKWHRACPELHIVQDADRLDAIGAVGVLRCAAFSGAKGRTLVGKGAGVDTAEQHFYDKLLNVKDRMKTDAGRQEAERRHQHMLDFLRALDQEQGREA